MSFALRFLGRLGETVDKCRARITATSMFLLNRDVELPQDTAVSHKWLLEAGFIKQSCSGVYYMLPLAHRTLENIIYLVEQEMTSVGGARMVAPILTPSALWKKSGRWEDIGPELFRLKDEEDSHDQYCIAPTHEEAFTTLAKEEVLKKLQLPLKLYQIETKFRNETRPRQGLLRTKEFLMKDMYSFDLTEEDAKTAYNKVCSAYDRLFDRLSLPIQKVEADTGTIGGSLSHEYHVISQIGEDTIYTCERCGCASNSELVSKEALSLPQCPHTSETCPLNKEQAIEIAHAFLLGTKYSSIFDASILNVCGPLQMGCYGIGITRLLQTLVEHSLTKHNGRMIWPRGLAPFSVCVAPLCHTEDSELMKKGHELYDKLQSQLPDDVILEDRLHLSIGKRLRHIELLGYPITIVFDKKTGTSHVELRYQEGSEIVVETVLESEAVERTMSKLVALSSSS